jgi:hypothetical protein
VTPDQTTWDILKELALYEKDYVVKVKNFNMNNYQTMRQTVYVGPKYGAYISGDDEGYKYNAIKNMMFPSDINVHAMSMDAFDPTEIQKRSGFAQKIDTALGQVPIVLSRWFNNEYMLYHKHVGSFGHEVEQDILKELLYKETINGAFEQGKYNEILSNLEPENLENNIDRQNAIKYLSKSIMNHMSTDAATKTHFISSYTNLIENNLIVNAEFYNKVTIQFPTYQPNPDPAKLSSEIFALTRLRNEIFGSGSGLSTQTFTMDDNIKPSDIREYFTFQKNIDTDANQVGTGKIRFNLKAEIDTVVESSTNTENAMLYEKLNKMATTIQSKTGFMSNTVDMGFSPFCVTKHKQNPGELAGTILLRSEDYWYRVKSPQEQIFTQSKGIAVEEYVRKLTQISDNQLSAKDIEALLLASYISYPEYYTVGRNILSDQAKKMYSGDIIVIGDLNIDAGDRCALCDVVNDMYGIFEVQSVVHKYSAQDGFITIITPALTTYVNDRKDIFDSSYLIERTKQRASSAIAGVTSAIAGVAGGGAALGSLLAAGVGGPPLWIITGAAVALGSSMAYFTVRHEMNIIAAKEAGDVLGRHAIGFVPIMRNTRPYVGGIGGYSRTTWKNIVTKNDVFVHGASVMENLSSVMGGVQDRTKTRDQIATPRPDGQTGGGE